MVHRSTLLRVRSLGATMICALTLLACRGNDSPAPNERSDGGAEGTDSPRRECQKDIDCTDHLICNGKELCHQGWCRAGSPPKCDDGIECTRDECDETLGGCRFEPPDRDGDGAPDARCLDQDGRSLGTDCDDQDPHSYPGAIEVCDAEHRDEDCDPSTIGSMDRDQDAHVDQQCCNEQPDGSMLCGTDCDDFKRSVHPGATEVCDFLDNDCNGEADEGVSIEMYPDKDHDGRGDELAPKTKSCPGSVGTSSVPGDCDDDDPEVFTGQFEICDGKDNNCDGQIDEIQEQAPWFVDSDGDGYGDPESAVVYSCYRLDGRVLSHNDCDDADRKVNPNAPELCDGRDNDCNGIADLRLGSNDFEDDDGDGIGDARCGGQDCDDRDPRTAEGADEVCDGVDNDCDGIVDEQTVQNIWYVDEDGDGWGQVQGNAYASCYPVPYRTTRYGDCADDDPTRFPQAVELCDGIDNDCDGTVDEHASLFCEIDGAIATCRSGSCQIKSCLSGFVLDQNEGDAECVVDPDSHEVVPCEVDDDCSDGNVCNGVETCAQQQCRKGTPLNCEFTTTLFGDAYIESGTDVASLLGIETITGTLTIKSPHLTSLLGLEALKTIGGGLLVEENAKLKRLSGSALSNLETVGGPIVIRDNPALVDADLPSLSSAYSLIISRNAALTKVAGYQRLASVGYQLQVAENPQLASISGFGMLQYLGGEHTQLDPLSGGCSGDIAGGLRLRHNLHLSDVSAFESLRRIGGDLCLLDLEAGTMLLPELRQVGRFVKMTGGASLDLPKLSSLDYDLAFAAAPSPDSASKEPITLRLSKLKAARALTFSVDGLPIGGLYLQALEEVSDLSVDFSSAESDFQLLDLSRLRTASSVHLDVAGPELQGIVLSDLTDAHAVLLRAIGPKVALVDLSSLISAGSLEIYTNQNEGPVAVELEHLTGLDPPADSVGLALCTGVLAAQQLYHDAPCELAQQLLDLGVSKTLPEATCGQCESAEPACLAGCSDDNECTSDECVDGSCVYFSSSPGTSCSRGVCSGGGDVTCVACLDDHSNSGDIDTGCSAGAPQCVETASGVACAGCSADEDCTAPGVCSRASCTQGFCEVSALPQGTACDGGVCDAGVCRECVVDANCDEGFCSLGTCVECLSDTHCPGGACDAGTCVECLLSSQCEDENDCTSNACVNKKCTHPALLPGTPCEGGVCQAGGSCVNCLDDSSAVDSGCDSSHPRCVGQEAPRCVECESAPDCSPPGECQVASCNSGTCSVTDAASGTPCSAGVCSAGSCVECLNHSHCASGACSAGACVPCVDDQADPQATDSGCSAGAPQCAVSAQGASCVGCSADDHCQDPGECQVARCDGGTCRVSNASQGTTCSGGVCNAGSCAECIVGGNQCGELICDDGNCVQCVSDDHCEGYCDAGMCVECKTSAHCNDQNACTNDVCGQGACRNDALPEGTACGGSAVCSADSPPECVECVSASSCDDGVDCTVDRCTRNTCTHTPDDNLCPASADVCRPYSCSATLDCRTSYIGSTEMLIDSETLDGSFEFGVQTGWRQEPERRQTVFVQSADSSGGGTKPHHGSWFAWLGGLALDTMSITERFDLPAGSTHLQLIVDTNFQTESTEQNLDTLVVELLDVQGAVLTRLASFSNQDASVKANEWTAGGIKAQVDVTKWAGMKGAGLRFTSSTDRSVLSDFMLDNVRLSVEICQ